MRRLPDGLILLAGGSEVIRNNDVPYPFRQDSDFLYLTGVEEPKCRLLLDPKRRSATLYIPRIDVRHRVWEGHVPGPAESRRLYGVPRAAYSDALPADLRRAKRRYRRIYADDRTLRLFRDSLRGLKPRPAGLRDALDTLRAVKSPGEVSLLKRASRVASAAHAEVMARALPGMREYDIQAIFGSFCRRAGLKHLAFPTTAAAGANSAVLHYRRDDAVLRRGGLLLLDAGAEHRGYAADITRTIPVGPAFTRRQRDVYSIVLETQKACINRSRAGTTSTDLHRLSMRLIAEGLRDMRILKGGLDGLVDGGAVRLFYPHGIGHLMGLDVHDVSGGKSRRLANPEKVPIRFVARLEPGFVMTVEPGIYFIPALLKDKTLRRKHRRSVDFARAESFLSMGGIRIEDNVVIRASGRPLNLTSVPKEIRDIERIRAKALRRGRR